MPLVGTYQWRSQDLPLPNEQYLEGATFIDVGAYSSKPGAEFVSEGEELARLLPVIELILAKRTLEANKFIKEFSENDMVKIVNGMYGPYIQIGKRNVKIPKGQKPEELTLEDCLALGDSTPVTLKKRKK